MSGINWNRPRLRTGNSRVEHDRNSGFTSQNNHNIPATAKRSGKPSGPMSPERIKELAAKIAASRKSKDSQTETP